MLAKMLADSGGRPFCLSRGYGGSEAGPKLVDDRTPTLPRRSATKLCCLARAAPTVIARERAAGAELAKAQGASVIVHRRRPAESSLAKDFTFAVIDAGAASAMAACSRPALYGRRWMRSLHAATRCWSSATATPPRDVAERLRARTRPVFHGRLVPDLGRVSATSGAQHCPGLRRHWRPGQVFCDRARGRHRCITRRSLSGPSPVHAARSQRAHPTRPNMTGLTLLTTEKDRARMDGDPRNWRRSPRACRCCRSDGHARGRGLALGVIKAKLQH